jgi:hypothetical protein
MKWVGLRDDQAQGRELAAKIARLFPRPRRDGRTPGTPRVRRSERWP